MSAENKKHFLALSIFLLFVTGCVSTHFGTAKKPISGQIYVETFTGRAGPIISTAIRIEFQKQDLLTSEDKAKFVLTGHSYKTGWSDGSSFELKDKNGVLFLSGTASSGGALIVPEIGKQLAKKIVKKIKVNSDVRR